MSEVNPSPLRRPRGRPQGPERKRIVCEVSQVVATNGKAPWLASKLSALRPQARYPRRVFHDAIRRATGYRLSAIQQGAHLQLELPLEISRWTSAASKS